MIKIKIVFSLVFTLLWLLVISCNDSPKQSTGSHTEIDLTEIKKVIEAIDQQFADDFSKGDSLALAAHYAGDGSFGSVKGKDNLVSAWGKVIRNAVKNGTPNIKYTSNTLFSADSFLIETGLYQYMDVNGIVKRTGKYLVVWKQEDGQWKIYRDIGL